MLNQELNTLLAILVTFDIMRTLFFLNFDMNFNNPMSVDDFEDDPDRVTADELLSLLVNHPLFADDGIAHAEGAIKRLTKGTSNAFVDIMSRSDNVSDGK